MLGAFRKMLPTSVTFISQAAMNNPAVAGLGLSRPLEPVKNTRAVGNKDMVHKHWQPRIEVDSEVC